MAQARITVVGGFVMELIFQAPRRPTTGETIYGTAFDMMPGGKGFRQAVAASRAGGKVVAIGRMGQDDFGDTVLKALVKENVETRWLLRDPAHGTAVTSPLVTESGHDSLIAVPRANFELSVEDISRATQVLANSGVVLLHLDVPLEVSKVAAALGHSGGAKVIFTPAPYDDNQEISDDILQLVDILVVNEHVAAGLTGHTPGEASAESMAQTLRARGARRVVVTLGAGGCLLVERQGVQHFPAFRVDAIDPTGAGEAFTGALAVAIAERQIITRALRFANAAGALAATMPGTIQALPTRYAIERLLREQDE
ncbi:MAG: ribokinase [Anaerolineae bacterium]|nr:ribokinase [Anaerolineae bacterium]